MVSVFSRLDESTLSAAAETITQIQRERALARGDLDAIIQEAFLNGFGSNNLPLLPWVEGNVVVCPGGLVSKSYTNHTCRFISVNDCWVWESQELIREDKRSTPGPKEGFQAIALVPALDGMQLDVVSGKARGGQHSVDKVISYEVKKQELIEVSQRIVKAQGMR